MSDAVRLKDFSKKRKDIEFALDGETYVLFKAISVPSLQELSATASEFQLETAVESLAAFFRLIMPKEHADRLIHKLAVDKEEPLEVDQAVDIMNWALEQYGLRPTQSSSASSSGSPTDGDGTLSADGA